LKLINTNAAKAYEVLIKENGYGKNEIKKRVAAGAAQELVLDLKGSHGWYDFSVLVAGADRFEQRYAGRVETGVASFSDPVMAGIV
jgi:phospholipase C